MKTAVLLNLIIYHCMGVSPGGGDSYKQCTKEVIACVDALDKTQKEVVHRKESFAECVYFDNNPPALRKTATPNLYAPPTKEELEQARKELK